MRYIIFDGVDSRSMGLHIDDQQPLPIASSNLAQRMLAGRDGFVTIGDSGRGGAVQRVDCFLEDTSRLPEVRAWLRAGRRGRLIVSDDAGHYMDAVILQGATLYHYTAHTVAFSALFAVQPWLYHSPEAADIVLTASGNIRNPGTAYAAPLYRIEGSGDIMLMQSGGMITLEGIEDGILIDADAEIATDLTGTHNHMSKVSGDLSALWLLSGSNALSWSGNVTSITVTPRWRDY